MVIFGVSNDAPAKNLKFKQKFSFPFDLLSDEDNAMALQYGAVATLEDKAHARISYIINPQGVVQKAYPKVSAAAHPEQVLQDL